MKMSTRPANEIAIARARHISPFGNPIKEHNPCLSLSLSLSVRCSHFPPFSLFAPPPQPRAVAEFPRKSHFPKKCAPVDYYPSRDFESTIAAFSPPRSSSSSSSSSSIPALGFSSIVLSSILLFCQ
jgi:hypothetical protein